jgi:hypothetical protein
VPNARHPTIAVGLGRGFINLSRMTQARVLEQYMRVLGPGTEHEKTDIALCRLDPGTWQLIVPQKNKESIDLDAWKEPDWSNVRWGLAAGYPNEHKKDIRHQGQERVANQLIVVVAERAAALHSGQRTVTRNSVLADPHSWYFSGLSGGPLYVVKGFKEGNREDDELFPVGIVFEGFPSIGREDALANRDVAAAFLSDKDLFIRAHALTPEIFDEWVRDCGSRTPSSAPAASPEEAP